MKMPLTILAVVAVLLLGFMLLAPRPGPNGTEPRTDLPWQITVNPDGSSRVFDLELGSATLADAMAKFGGLEGLAVFEAANGAMSLEGYFGNVQFGPLRAKIIVRLAAEAAELDALRAASAKREGTPSGDWKYPLKDSPQRHADRVVAGLSYIPGTRNLDADFLRARFGEPAAWRQESEHVISWYFPRLGLSLLLDAKAREVLEYVPPRDFVMPADAMPNPAAP